MSNKILTIELKDGEKIKEIIRESIWVIAPRIILVVMFFVILFFFFFTFIAIGPIGIIVFISLFFAGILMILGKFFHWYRNVFIITTERIIDLEQSGFLNKSISEISLHKIENIHYRIRGIFQNIFRCGDIFIQSRGGATILMLRNVKKPAQIQSFLLKILSSLEG